MIWKNTILSLVVACVLLLVGPAANAAPNLIGQCNSLAARLIAPEQHISRGIEVVHNCGTLLAALGNFMAAGCDEPFNNGELFVSDIFENGESCNLLAVACDALFGCFGEAGTPDACVLVPDCTIPSLPLPAPGRAGCGVGSDAR